MVVFRYIIVNTLQKVVTRIIIIIITIIIIIITNETFSVVKKLA
jgi:hypothetical protein